MITTTQQRDFFNRPRLGWHILLISVLSIIAYANTFQVPFSFDDYNEIVNNPIIKDLGYFRDPLSASGFPANHGLKMRIIGYFTFAMNYRIGGTNVFGYHLFNFVVHLLNSLLVYKLVLKTVSMKFAEKQGMAGQASLSALIVALIFALHPLQTGAVTYIVQRLTSLATFFYLLSLTSYIDTRQKSIRQQRGRAALWYGVAVLSAVAAMKTKEISFTLPVIISLYELRFFHGILWKRVLTLIPLLGTMLIIPMNLLSTHKPVGEIISDVSVVSRVDQTVSRLDYLCTQFRVIVTYLRMLIFPVGQNLDHAYPVHPNFFAPEVFLSFLFLVALFAVAVFCLIPTPCLWAGQHLVNTFSKRQPGTPERIDLSEESAYLHLIGFGLLWFFITLSVESSIIPINDVMFEHRLYLPSIGFFLAFVTAATWLVRRLKKNWPAMQWLALSVTLVIVLTLTGATFLRNQVWQSPLTLWQDVVAKSPHNVRGYNNIGIYFDMQGEPAKAIPYFQQAVAIKPDYAQALFNLGIAYASLQEHQQATVYYLKALALKPKDPKILFNLGVTYLSSGALEPAEMAFQEALNLAPEMQQARMFLDYILRQKSQAD